MQSSQDKGLKYDDNTVLPKLSDTRNTQNKSQQINIQLELYFSLERKVFTCVHFVYSCS